jgi:single-strand DNA-binding protein
MNDTYITIVGNVVDEPRLRMTSTGGVPVLSFRVASTSRRLDRETGKWQDSDRLFEYTSKDETSRMSYEVDAAAVGHDLARGISEFTKVARPAATTTVDVGPDGMPEDLTDQRFDPAPARPEVVLAAVG